MHDTLCLKKCTTWCLLVTLAGVDRFSTFFHQLIRKKIIYVYTIDFHLTCNMLLHYLWKSKIQKNVTDFDSIFNKLLTCSWGHF